MYRNILVRTEDSVGRITLNRPERHNAFDDQTIAELSDALAAMEASAEVRVILIASAGQHFCAGADLKWMLRAAARGAEENLVDARKFATMLGCLARMPKPTVARVQGVAYGGGVGLVSACDIAVATADARFALTEVRLGLIPAVIGPHVVAAIGPRQARRYMLTAQPFSAAEAHRLGLVHELAVDIPALDGAVNGIVAALLANGPQAQAECKSLIAAVAGRPLDDPLIEDTARRIARIRATDEAREGMAAFLARRRPRWPAGD